MKDNIESYIKPARLIPSSEKEQRATSILLACFRIVPDFAREILKEANIYVPKRSTISCFTEVVFKKSKLQDKKSRPDGLIIIKAGNKIWSAIFESKIANNLLDKNQIEEYLDLAKLNNINALITISNQYVTTPTHSPIQVSKQKLRNTDLYHFSWLFIETKANLLLKNKKVEDPEQAIILTELIHYLKDPRSGVTSFSQMGKGWREISLAINKGIKIKKNDPSVDDAISSWQQYSKYLSIKLSDHVRRPVYEYLSRSRIKDSNINYQVNLDDLTIKDYLDAEYEIPNAASRLHLIANFKTRTITIEMSLDAPQDRTYPQSCITWLTRQLSKIKDEDIEIRVNWNRGVTEMQKLSVALDDPLKLIPKGVKDLPKTLDVVEVIDLAGKFSSNKSFVEETTKRVLLFYSNVAENLRKWVPKPLKGKEVEVDNTSNSDTTEQNTNPFWLPPIQK